MCVWGGAFDHLQFEINQSKTGWWEGPGTRLRLISVQVICNANLSSYSGHVGGGRV